MNASKVIVSLVVLIILVGVAAWSWVNFTQATLHDPEVSQQYLKYFDRICPVEYDNPELCDQVIGSHHRQCFDDHLRFTPEDELAEKGPVIYDRTAYMTCMRDALTELL